MILCCIWWFISYLCYSIYYHFYYYLSRVIFLSHKCRIKTNSFSLFFSSRHIWRYVLINSTLLFFMETCFVFYVIAILICYLYFIIYRKAHNVFGKLLQVSFLAKFVTGDLELGKKRGPDCSKKIMGCFQL